MTMSRQASARFDHVMQSEDVSERDAEDSQCDDTLWLAVPLWLVFASLFLVAINESFTRPDSDGIEHQFDPTWGERVEIFIGMTFINAVSILLFGRLCFAIARIGTRKWTLVRDRRATRP
ncbi:MAG: hypothetical protein ABWZ15_01255 [Acidimicrobiia bacterium]